jgi:hypothetical protein
MYESIYQKTEMLKVLGVRVIEVDEDCNITYSDGSVKPCPYRPSMTFQNCVPGYGSHGLCEKWNRR